MILVVLEAKALMVFAHLGAGKHREQDLISLSTENENICFSQTKSLFRFQNSF